MLTVKDVYEVYAPRILALLERIRQDGAAHGVQWSAPDETSDDCYSWDMYEPTRKIGLTFEISEQRAYEGKGGGDGINFSLTLVRDGGQILGGFTPFNYTPQVWVPLALVAVEERFQMMEGLDPSDVTELVGGK